MHGSMLKHHRNMLETNLREVIFLCFFTFLFYPGGGHMIPAAQEDEDGMLLPTGGRWEKYEFSNLSKTNEIKSKT